MELHSFCNASLRTLKKDKACKCCLLPMIVSAVVYSASVFGPALGYICGGQLLDIYVDTDTVDSDL